MDLVFEGVSPNKASIGERGFDDSFIEPPDSCEVGAPQLAHSIYVQELSLFSFGNFVFDMRGPREFVVKKNTEVFDSVGVFDRRAIQSEGREGGFWGFVFTVKEESSSFFRGEL